MEELRSSPSSVWRCGDLKVIVFVLCLSLTSLSAFHFASYLHLRMNRCLSFVAGASHDNAGEEDDMIGCWRGRVMSHRRTHEFEERGNVKKQTLLLKNFERL